MIRFALVACALVGCGGDTASTADASSTDAGSVVDTFVYDGPLPDWRIRRVTIDDGISFHEIPGFSLNGDESSIYYATYLGDPCRTAGMPPGYDFFVGTRSAFAKYQAVRLTALNTGWRETSPMVARDSSFLLFAREDNVSCTTALGSHLWISKRAGTSWEAPTRLDDLGGGSFTITQPAVSPMGDEIFYTVYARVDDAGPLVGHLHRGTGKVGAWSPVGAIGAPIATAYQDEWPFVTADGNWLYFGSDRPGGTGGGVDIWRARRSGAGEYDAPEPLPYPINSPAADSVPRVSDDGKRIYFQRGSSIWLAEAIGR